MIVWTGAGALSAGGASRTIIADMHLRCILAKSPSMTLSCGQDLFNSSSMTIKEASAWVSAATLRRHAVV